MLFEVAMGSPILQIRKLEVTATDTESTITRQLKLRVEPLPLASYTITGNGHICKTGAIISPASKDCCKDSETDKKYSAQSLEHSECPVIIRVMTFTAKCGCCNLISLCIPLH